MKHLLLALALLAYDYTVSPRAFELPCNHPDLELHPHTDDEVVGGQLPCGTGPQGTCDFEFACGSIGTSFDLFMHRVRCGVSQGTDRPKSIHLEPGSPCYLFIGSGSDQTFTPDGWSLVSGVCQVRMVTSTSQGGTGLARWRIVIPNDPALIGTLVYFQGGAYDFGAPPWRESSGGFLEIVP